MYLHPVLKGQTNLSRLTKIYQWKDPLITESDVFEVLRNKLDSRTEYYDYLRTPHLNQWIKDLPASVVTQKSVQRSWAGELKRDGRLNVIQRLPEVLAIMESMVETGRRFNAYELEIKAISQLGISFSEWQQLKPSERNSKKMNLMFIVPKEPISVA
ncbi:hypothetical protein PN441_12520 [Spirulina major CS-329]|nr:hypothetical protein [Spirulina major]MDB9494774.1 hypothetical protein [Spirulina subsalsa CS-330]MDB9503896.1 hypothetical protein [Spirulina major CS-329]